MVSRYVNEMLLDLTQGRGLVDSVATMWLEDWTFLSHPLISGQGRRA